MGELIRCVSTSPDLPSGNCYYEPTIQTVSGDVNPYGIGWGDTSGDMKDNRTPSERLRFVREKRGFQDAAEAARRFGWKEAGYRHHENGTRPIKVDAAKRYGSAFLANPAWILFGDDYATGPRKDTKGDAYDPLAHIAWRRIPVLNVKMLLPDKSLQYALDQSSEFVVVPGDDIFGPLTFSKPVPDDSMLNASSQDSFKPGEIVIFDGEAKAMPGDYVFVEIFREDGCLFRQYRLGPKDKDGNQIVILTPNNPHYPMMEIVENKTGRILGRLIRHIRRY